MMNEDWWSEGTSEIKPISAFRDFHLRVARDGQGRPTVQVVNSPAGSTEVCKFTIPKGIEKLDSLICLEAPLTDDSGTAQEDIHQDYSPIVPGLPTLPSDGQRDLQPERQEPSRRRSRASVDDHTRIQDLGTELFDGVMVGAVRDRYLESRDDCPMDAGLRIRLSFNAEAHDEALEGIPWEILHEPSRGFLCLDRRSPIVRSLSPHPTQLSTPDKLPFPLRMLVVESNPEDAQPLELAQEANNLRAALGLYGAIETRALKSGKELGEAQRNVFRRALLERELHLAHFMGHAREDRLHLLDQYNRKDPVEARLLAPLFWGLPKLRFVFLNACATARGVSNSNLVPRLIATGLPAVLGTRCEIYDDAALVFSRCLYQRIAAGDPVDAAITEARIALSLELPDRFDWLIPILFLQANDGRIFNPPQGRWIDPITVQAVKEATTIPFTLMGRRTATATTIVTQSQWAKWGGSGESNSCDYPRGDSPQLGINIDDIKRVLTRTNDALRKVKRTEHLYLDIPTHAEWSRAVQVAGNQDPEESSRPTKPLTANELDLAPELSLWCRRTSESDHYGASSVITMEGGLSKPTPFHPWPPGYGHEELGFRPVLKLLGESYDSED